MLECPATPKTKRNNKQTKSHVYIKFDFTSATKQKIALCNNNYTIIFEEFQIYENVFTLKWVLSKNNPLKNS
jgi:hypothetical protein